MDFSEPMERRCWSPLLLIVAGVVVYANSLSSPFVFDDLEAIAGNQTIRQWWPETQAQVGGATAGRPLVRLSLAFNYALGGLEVDGYRAFNIAVHLLNGLLLWGLARRTLERIGAGAAGGVALAGALLWVVHPLNAECINYVSQRTELIAGLFYLLTLYCGLRASDGEREGRWKWAAVLCCGLGMASKEVVVTAPLMVVLYDRIFLFASWKESWRRRRDLYIGLAATWGVLIGLMAGAPRGDTVGFAHGVSPLQYAMNQCAMLVTYFRLSLWPRPLVVDYGLPQQLGLADVWPEALVVIALLGITGAALARRPRIGFLPTWAFVVLSPTSSWVPIVTEVGAERRMYLPLAGLAVLAGVLGRRMLERAGWRGAKGGLVALAALALGWTTVRRNETFASRLSLWEETVAAVPENPRAHNNLGRALADADSLAGAVEQFERAVELKPDFVEAHHNLATAFKRQGDMARAAESFGRALALDPDFIEARLGLGRVLLAQGQVAAGAEELRRAAARRPGDAALHFDLGLALRLLEDWPGAARHLERATRLAPEWPQAYYELGFTLHLQGRIEAAIEQYGRALALDPALYEAHYNLGVALNELGRADEALRQFRRALEGNPALYEAHYEMGEILAARGQAAAAIEQFRRVLQLYPEHADARRRLEELAESPGR